MSTQEDLAAFNAAAGFDAELAPDEDTAVETEAPAEAAETADERPRDEAGRFVAKETDEPKLLAGKYKTPEELAAAYESLQEAFGRQGAELGQYRQQAPPTVFGRDQIEENPGQVAAQIAWQALQAGGNPEGDPTYEAALREWFDIDPYEASNFRSTLDRVRFQAELEARTAPVQSQLAEQQQQAALAQLVRQHPDLPQYGAQIQQAAQEYPALAAALNSEDPSARVEAMRALYGIAKASAPPPQGETADTASHARQLAAEADRAKQEAAVVTGGSNNTAPVSDPTEDLMRTWASLDISQIQ